MSGAVALQALVSGLGTGAAYGLIALGFTLVRRLTGVLALAQGDIAVGAVFLAVLAVIGTTPIATTPSAAQTAGLLILALAAGGALSVLVYLAALRPFLPVRSRPGGSPPLRSGGRGGDVLGWVAGGLAAGLAIRAGLALPFSQEAYAIPDVLRTTAVVHLGGGLTVPVRALLLLVVGLAVGAGVERGLARTGAGALVRAVSDDPGAAALLGVPAERVVLAAFALAGALAGLAGLLVAPERPLGVQDGVVLGLKGIAAALLLRAGSLRYAMLGGLAVGVLEALVVAWGPLGAAWGDVVPLALLVVLAALRPEGVLAR
jgi:branched-subunit amino acid ABC-type transport system permease component